VNGDNGEKETSSVGGDLILPLMAVGLTAYYLITTADMDWEARSTGLFVGTVILALCSLLLIRVVFTLATGRAKFGFGGLLTPNLHNAQRIGLLALSFGFIAALPWLGTTLGLFLLLFLSMLVMGVRDWRPLLGISIITSLVVYVLLIYLLSSRLPPGPFEKLVAPILGVQG
jgi:hypothetical protein